MNPRPKAVRSALYGLGLVLTLLGGAGLLGGCPRRRDMASAPDRYDSGVGPSRWNDWSNLSLDAMVDRYGPPTRIESKRVVWEDKAPFKRIAVWDRMENFQGPGAADNIEQTIAYLVPDEARPALKAFSRRVGVSDDGTELSSISFSPERNLLTLNLADQVIRGTRSPQEASDFYELTLRLEAAGKSTPYTQRLLFVPPPLPETR